jgi:hypothetical protein
MVTASGEQLFQNWVYVEMELIGTAVDQKATGEDGSHRVGWLSHCDLEGKEKQRIVISKQQLKDYNESIWYRLIYTRIYKFYIVLTCQMLAL